MALSALAVSRRSSDILGLLAAGRIDVASAEIQRALVAVPGHPRFVALAAEVRRRQGQRREAQALLRQAEAAGPDDPVVLRVRAELAQDSGELDKAVEDYRRLVDRGGSAYLAGRLVQALRRSGRLDEAADTARAALERHPEDPWLRRFLADVERRRGRTAVAVELLEGLVEEGGGSKDYAALLGARTETMPPEEAAPALQRLMRTGARARNPALHRIAAEKYRLAGQDKEAAAEYEAALALDGRDAYCRAQLGFAHRRLGDADRAIAELRLALLSDPRSPYVTKSLIAACRDAARLPELLEWLAEAQKLHPDTRELFGLRRKVAGMIEAASAPAPDAPAGPATRGVRRPKTKTAPKTAP